jgi:adenine nucleotide transporter 17
MGFSGWRMSSAAVNGLAGAGGGIIAQIITYPLQTVNTRQQTERSAKKKKANGAAIANTSTLFQMLQVVPPGILVYLELPLLMF